MCSYCGCREISVIGRFSREHDEITDAAAVMRRAAEEGDLVATRAALTVLAGMLAPHTGSEERGLFAELRTDPEFTEHVDLLCGEHHEIDERVAKVAAGDLAGARDLETFLRRHVDREENGLFPAAAVTLDGPAWERVVAAS